METPLVSICSITYNHAPFIRQCLDGFLMQQCNFPIEIIINDDCSTDGTTKIIREYAEKYPDKIFPIFHEENLYSQGVRGMFQKFVFPKARGKYIALCEGDDYWTDPLKLQKQVDFLESHPDYSMCCHAALVRTRENEVIFTHNPKYDCNLSSEDIFVKGGEFVITASICCRNSIMSAYEDFALGAPVGDYPLQIWCAIHGKVRHLKDCMSVYNSGHEGSWTLSTTVSWKIVLENIILWLEKKKENYPSKFKKLFNAAIARNIVYYSLYYPENNPYVWKINEYISYLRLPIKLQIYFALKRLRLLLGR